MLDKLLPPKLKKKPKKLQRQATFLDKPKESLKKTEVRPRLLGAGHVLFVRGHLRYLPGPDLREQVQILYIAVSGKSVDGRRVAPQKVLREHGDQRRLAVVG